MTINIFLKTISRPTARILPFRNSSLVPIHQHRLQLTQWVPKYVGLRDPFSICWLKETLNLATVVRFSVDRSGDRHRLRVLRNTDK